MRLEKEYYDGAHGPIPVDVLYANLKRKNPEIIKQFPGIVKMLIMLKYTLPILLTVYAIHEILVLMTMHYIQKM